MKFSVHDCEIEFIQGSKEARSFFKVLTLNFQKEKQKLLTSFARSKYRVCFI